MTSFNLNNRALDIYTIDKQNDYMLADYMQEERRSCDLKRTPNKKEQNELMDSGGLTRFMTCQPRTYSQFLYNSPLVAHMLTVFKTSTMNIKTMNTYEHVQLYIATLYQP